MKFNHRFNTAHGLFVNPDGYREHKVGDIPYLWLFTKTVFYVEMREHPLIFKRLNGIWYKTKGTFYSDHGTIPLTAQPFLPKDRFLLSYLIHDSACIQHGLWISRDKGKSWGFEFMLSSEVHDLLGEMVRAEDANLVQFHAVHKSTSTMGPKWELAA